MAAVYSTQFIFSHGSHGELYTVGDEFRAVLRWVTGFNSDGVLDHIIHLTETVTGATIVQANLNPQQSESLEFRVVLYAGQQIRNDSDGEVDITVSGYLLTLP